MADDMPPPQYDAIPSLKSFYIPKAKNKELLTKISLDSREGQDIIEQTRKSLWNPESMTIDYKTIKIVHNQKLAKRYAEKRKEMKEKKHKDTVDSYAFLLFRKVADCVEVCKNGLCTKRQTHLASNFMEIGDKKYGVYLNRCADTVSRSRQLYDYKTDFVLLMFKVIKGRLKQMAPVSPSSPNSSQVIEPSPNYDGHVSKKFQLGKKVNLEKMYDASLLYLYEIDLEKFDTENEDAMYAQIPSQVLPYAIITLQAKQKVLSTMVPPARPISRAPVNRDRTMADQSVNQQNIQETNRGFVYNDYLNSALEHWEGSYYNGSQEYTRISLRLFTSTPLKLPLRNKQNLCITQKISLEKLKKIFPPKIFRRLPCENTSKSGPTALIDGLTFLHAEIHPPQSSPNRNLIDKLHYHFLKNNMAGFCCFPLGCKLYVIPTCEFTDDLGITNPDYPSILHCIFMSSYNSTLQPEKMEIFHSERFLNFRDRQRRAFLDRWHDNEELKTFHHSPEDVTKREYAFSISERRMIINCLNSIKNAQNKNKSTTQSMVTDQLPPATSSNRLPVPPEPPQLPQLINTSTTHLVQRGISFHMPTLHPVDRGLATITTTTPVDAINDLDNEKESKLDIKMDEQALELLKQSAPDSYEMLLRSTESDVTDSDRLVVMSDSQDIDEISQNGSQERTPQKQIPLSQKDIKEQLAASPIIDVEKQQQLADEEEEEEMIPDSQGTVDSQESERTEDEEIPLIQQSDVDFHSDSLVIDTATQESTSQDEGTSVFSEISSDSIRHPPVNENIVMTALTDIKAQCYDIISPESNSPIIASSPVEIVTSDVSRTFTNTSSIPSQPTSFSNQFMKIEKILKATLTSSKPPITSVTTVTTTITTTTTSSSTVTNILYTTISDDDSPKKSSQYPSSPLSLLKKAMREKVETVTPQFRDKSQIMDASSSGSDLDDIQAKLQQTRDKNQSGATGDLSKSNQKHIPKAYQPSRGRDNSSERTSSSHRRHHDDHEDRHRSRSRSRHRRRRSRSRSRSRSPRRHNRYSRERSSPQTLPVSHSPSPSPYYPPPEGGTIYKRLEAVSKKSKDKLTSSVGSEAPSSQESPAHRHKETSTSQVQATTTATKKTIIPISQPLPDFGSKIIDCENVTDSDNDEDSITSRKSGLNKDSQHTDSQSGVDAWLNRADEKMNKGDEDQRKRKSLKTRREREEIRKKTTESKVSQSKVEKETGGLIGRRNTELTNGLAESTEGEIIDYRLSKITAKPNKVSEKITTTLKDKRNTDPQTNTKPYLSAHFVKSNDNLASVSVNTSDDPRKNDKLSTVSVNTSDNPGKATCFDKKIQSLKINISNSKGNDSSPPKKGGSNSTKKCGSDDSKQVDDVTKKSDSGVTRKIVVSDGRKQNVVENTKKGDSNKMEQVGVVGTKGAINTKQKSDIDVTKLIEVDRTVMGVIAETDKKVNTKKPIDRLLSIERLSPFDNTSINLDEYKIVKDRYQSSEVLKCSLAAVEKETPKVLNALHAAGESATSQTIESLEQPSELPTCKETNSKTSEKPRDPRLSKLHEVAFTHIPMDISPPKTPPLPPVLHYIEKPPPPPPNLLRMSIPPPLPQLYPPPPFILNPQLYPNPFFHQSTSPLPPNFMMQQRLPISSIRPGLQPTYQQYPISPSQVHKQAFFGVSSEPRPLMSTRQPIPLHQQSDVSVVDDTRRTINNGLGVTSSLSQWNSKIMHNELDNFCKDLIEKVANNF